MREYNIGQDVAKNIETGKILFKRFCLFSKNETKIEESLGWVDQSDSRLKEIEIERAIESMTKGKEIKKRARKGRERK